MATIMTININYDQDYKNEKNLWLCYDTNISPEHQLYTCDDEFNLEDVSSPMLKGIVKDLVKYFDTTIDKSPID